MKTDQYQPFCVPSPGKKKSKSPSVWAHTEVFPFELGASLLHPKAPSSASQVSLPPSHSGIGILGSQRGKVSLIPVQYSV